jgi:hypothetical protein
MGSGTEGAPGASRDSGTRLGACAGWNEQAGTSQPSKHVSRTNHPARDAHPIRRQPTPVPCRRTSIFS